MKLIQNFATAPIDPLKKVNHVREFHQNSIVGLIEAAKGIFEAYNDVIDDAEFETVTVKAYDELQFLMSKTIPMHIASVTGHIRDFFTSFDNIQDSNSMIQFEEEKQAWAMLAKQMIVDTENLDNSIEKCRPMSQIVSTTHGA